MAIVQPISIFTSPSYQQIYTDPFINDIGNAVTRSISAFRDSTNIPQPLVIGATSNLSLETANNMNMYAGMSNSFLYYQTWMNGSTRVDRQVLEVDANLTQTIFNFPQDVVLVSSSSNNPIVTIQDVTFSRNSSNTLIETAQSNFYFRQNITAAANLQVGQNMFVNGSVFSCNINVWAEKTDTTYSRVGYGFRINSNDQLELIKYAKYGSGDVLKKVAVFGTNPISSNDRSDSSNYLVFNSIGTMSVGNGDTNSFTPLNAYGTPANPLSNLYTSALTMSNVTTMDSSSVRFFQPSLHVQSVIYTSNDINIGGNAYIANTLFIGGGFSMSNDLHVGRNLTVGGSFNTTNFTASNLTTPGNITGQNLFLTGSFNTASFVASNITTPGNITGSNLYVSGSAAISSLAASNISTPGNLDVLSGTASINNLNVSGSATFNNGATINGPTTMNADLTVNGSVVFVNSSNMIVNDNIITLNNGLTGAPTTLTQTGFELKRGSASNSFFILYDESKQLLRAGFSNSEVSALKAVCTRVDSLANGYTYYDASSSNLINRVLSNADINDAPWSYTTSNVFYTNTGSVGIGTNTPNYKLHVQGDVFATDFKASSDRRLKKDFEVIGSALDKIHQISGYTFSRLTGEKRFAGVIAQEMQAVLPEVVDTDSEGFLNVSYGNVVALLIQGIKELDEKVNKLIA